MLEGNLETKKKRRKLIKRVSIILSLGILGLLIIIISSEFKDVPITEIKRGKYLEGEEEVALIMNVEGDGLHEIKIKVDSVQYAEEEVERLYQMFLSELEKNVLGENTDWDYVIYDLDFIKELEGYPFSITWESSNYKLLSRNGDRIIENITMEEIGDINETVVTAKIQYQGFERNIYYFPRLCLSEEEKEKMYIRELESEISEDEVKSREESVYYLPEEIGGSKVSFRKKSDSKYIEWIMLIVVLVIGVVVFEREKSNRESAERIRNLEKMYPEVVSKMALLLCAGYTIRNTWEKMVLDYEARGEKGFVYEQMKIADLQMKNGESEGKIYEKFGMNCNHQKYLVLGGLLSQNLKRGNKNLLQRMKEESKKAYTERREMAIVKSGKAETKMLIPMMMLLMIVLVVIVIPVFISI